MNASQTIEHLLKHVYTQFQRDEVIQEYGTTPWELTDISGIDVGDAGAQLAAVERMIDRRWVKIINSHSRLSRRRTGLLPSDSIQITEEGIKEAERLLSPFVLRHLRDIYVATIEGIARALGRQ